jgi:ketosteroid isomerase-like protein
MVRCDMIALLALCLQRAGQEYNNEYCWVVRFNGEGSISSVRAYLDTAKLRDALQGNE